MRIERIKKDKKTFKYWLKRLLFLFKPSKQNWFAMNIGYRNGIGRLVTPFDINRKPRQYQKWSGKKIKNYPVYTGLPKFLMKKK